MNHGDSTISSPKWEQSPTRAKFAPICKPLVADHASPMLNLNNATLPVFQGQRNQIEGFGNGSGDDYNNNNNVLFGSAQGSGPVHGFNIHEIGCGDDMQAFDDFASIPVNAANMLSKFGNPNVAAILGQILASQLGAFMPASGGCNLSNQRTASAVASAMVNDNMEKLHTEASIEDPLLQTPSLKSYLLHASLDGTTNIESRRDACGVPHENAIDRMDHGQSGLHPPEKDQSSSSAIDAHQHRQHHHHHHHQDEIHGVLDADPQSSEMVFLVNRRSKTVSFLPTSFHMT
jgi:hypothetical protein